MPPSKQRSGKKPRPGSKRKTPGKRGPLSPRQRRERMQKAGLVVLAALLIAVFTIPIGRMATRRRQEALGTLYGKEITREALEEFTARWRAFGLHLFGNGAFDTYLLLLAAREWGVKVGSGAIAEMLTQDPPQTRTIEYVIADPEKLAEGINPTDAELEAYYNRGWKDKSRKFEDVKEDVRRKLKDKLATQAAEKRIREAQGRIASAPREGGRWRDALRSAATELKLDYDQSEPFTEQYAAATGRALSYLRLIALAEGAAEDTRLPAGLAKAMFQAPIGQPSGILNSAGKHFIFRAIKSGAGFTSDGKLMDEDWGWRHGKFMKLEKYATYGDLVKAKRRRDVSEAKEAFEEYLTVKKFIALTCGGAAAGARMTRDAREQFLAYENERVKGLMVDVPVQPFLAEKPPTQQEVENFYNARKQVAGYPTQRNRFPLNFGYLQPDKIQIEYVIADPAAFEHLVNVTDAEVRDHYEKHKDAQFLADDGKTPKPLHEVRELIRKELRSSAAGRKAGDALNNVKKGVETESADSRQLEAAARVAGLQYFRSPPFAQHQIRSAVPQLADAPGFPSTAFATNMRPAPFKDRQGEEALRRPVSPTLNSGGRLFFFRLLKYEDPHAVDFSQLSPVEQWRARQECVQARAVRKAAEAARNIKGAIARELLGTIAAENRLSVQSAVVQSVEQAEGASPVPPVLAEHVRKKLKRFPGEIACLVRDGETCYTAVTTKIDREKDDVHIEYLRFKPEQFVAVIRPPQREIDARAARIRDAELEKKKKPEDDKKKEEPDETKPDPTEEQIEKAKAELINEWKQKDLRVRYLEYLHQGLTAAFRKHLDVHPLELDREIPLERRTTLTFFHIGDTHPFGGDKGLIKAAFQLKPDTLSGPLVGDSAAAVMMLVPPERGKPETANPQTRKERKLEFITVRPSDYDPLDVTVTDAGARKYYDAHKEEFRPPARAKAEFLFASFDRAAAAIKPAINEKEVEDYYRRNRNTAYQKRELDAELRKTIRSLLAKNRARATEAKLAIEAARAKVGDKPLAKAAELPGGRMKLTGGTTPVLGPDDNNIPGVGYAPSLVKAIITAKKGELSKPVQTDSGWAIFRVTEKPERALPEFKAVVAAARGKERQRRLAEKARKALEKVRAEVAKKKTSIEQVLKRPELAAGLPYPRGVWVVTTGYADAKRAAEHHRMTNALRNAAFRVKAGQTTAIIETKDGIQFARVIDAKASQLVKVHYVLVPASLYTPMVKISDKEAKEHYDANKAKYKRPRYCELEYLLADTWRLSRAIAPSDEDIKKTYEQLKHQFVDSDASAAGATVYRPLKDVRWDVSDKLAAHRARQQADELATKALAALAKDKAESLEAIAGEIKKLQHVSSAEYTPGGEDNPGALGDVPGLDAFLDSAKAGDTSPALRGPSGPLVVRLTKIHPAEVPPLEKVKRKVKEDVAVPRGLSKAKEMVEQVIAKIKKPATADSMGDAAALFSVHTKEQHRLAARDSLEVSRSQLQYLVEQALKFRPSAVFRMVVLGRLFELRFGEISPPLVAGERADICSLAILTQCTPPPPLSVQRAAEQDAINSQAVLEQRLRNLLTEIRKQARGPSSGP